MLGSADPSVRRARPVPGPEPEPDPTPSLRRSPPIPRWLPNAISIVRVLLVPVWVLAAEAATAAAATGDAATGWRRHAALAVLLVIGGSDVLDGWLARRFSLQSRFGATLDAVADKLAQVVLFTWLTLRESAAFAPVPPWFLALLIARDVVLLAGYLAIRARHGRVDTEHRPHGKVSSLLLFALLIAFSAGAPASVTTPLCGLAAALVAASTASYVRGGFRQYCARA